jgi:hypothetical protein
MRDFLDFIMPPDAFVEVRSIRDGKVKQWWEADRQAACDLAISQSDAGWDAYYGVLPRLDRVGDAEHIAPSTQVLWADLDAKTIGSKQAALMTLVRAPVPPSVVVDSGHGYHAYWRLDMPWTWELAHMAMVGIADDLRGDHVYDRARILRIPGTMNWKDPDAPVPVRAIVFDTTNVRPAADFYRWLDLGSRMSSPYHYRHTGTFTTPEHREALPDWLAILISDGAPQGQRSEACFKVMCHLLRRGWNDAEILTAFRGGGIGEKMRELRDGDRWFRRSLEKARAQL